MCVGTVRVALQGVAGAAERVELIGELTVQLLGLQPRPGRIDAAGSGRFHLGLTGECGPAASTVPRDIAGHTTLERSAVAARPAGTGGRQSRSAWAGFRRACWPPGRSRSAAVDGGPSEVPAACSRSIGGHRRPGGPWRPASVTRAHRRAARRAWSTYARPTVGVGPGEEGQVGHVHVSTAHRRAELPTPAAYGRVPVANRPNVRPPPATATRSKPCARGIAIARRRRECWPATTDSCPLLLRFVEQPPISSASARWAWACVGCRTRRFPNRRSSDVASWHRCPSRPRPPATASAPRRPGELILSPVWLRQVPGQCGRRSSSRPGASGAKGREERGEGRGETTEQAFYFGIPLLSPLSSSPPSCSREAQAARMATMAMQAGTYQMKSTRPWTVAAARLAAIAAVQSRGCRSREDRMPRMHQKAHSPMPARANAPDPPPRSRRRPADRDSWRVCIRPHRARRRYTWDRRWGSFPRRSPREGYRRRPWRRPPKWFVARPRDPTGPTSRREILEARVDAIEAEDPERRARQQTDGQQGRHEPASSGPRPDSTPTAAITVAQKLTAIPPARATAGRQTSRPPTPSLRK